MAGMESVLNPEGVRFVEMVDDLSLGSLETRYTFMDRDIHRDLLVRDMGEGMRVYWTEILQRAHLTAVTAILRSRRWLFGVVQAKADNNFLVFAANLRGLLESAADSSTALKDVPATLACHHFSISESLAGGPKGDFAPRQMEDQLIHYFHGEKAPGGGTSQCATVSRGTPSSGVPENLRRPERNGTPVLPLPVRPDPFGRLFRDYVVRF